MNDSDWVKIGVDNPPNLTGTIELLKVFKGPVVFLFDENHNDLDNKRQNASNAGHLVHYANIAVIGVESKSGEGIGMS
jgi:hypothetical protein